MKLLKTLLPAALAIGTTMAASASSAKPYFSGFYLGAQAGAHYSTLKPEDETATTKTDEKSSNLILPNLHTLIGYRFAPSPNFRVGLEAEGVIFFTPHLQLGFTSDKHLFFASIGYNLWGLYLKGYNKRQNNGVTTKDVTVKSAEFPSLLQGTIGYEHSVSDHTSVRFSLSWTHYIFQGRNPNGDPEAFLGTSHPFRRKDNSAFERATKVTINQFALNLGVLYHF